MPKNAVVPEAIRVAIKAIWRSPDLTPDPAHVSCVLGQVL